MDDDRVFVPFEVVALLAEHGFPCVFDGPSYMTGLALRRDQFEGRPEVEIVHVHIGTWCGDELRTTDALLAMLVIEPSWGCLKMIDAPKAGVSSE